jgi:hypothetical protein
MRRIQGQVVITLRLGMDKPLIERNQAVELFELRGYTTCRYFVWPDVSDPVPGATNRRLIILNPVTDPRGPSLSAEEIRAALNAGWLAGGGSTEHLL